MCLGLQALQSLPLRFFTTEAVPLKLSTHKTMDLQFGTDTHKEELKFGIKGGGGCDNWVVASERLNSKSSLCI